MTPRAITKLSATAMLLGVLYPFPGYAVTPSDCAKMGMIVAPGGTACTPRDSDGQLQTQCLIYQANAQSLWTLRLASTPKQRTAPTAINMAHRHQEWMLTKGAGLTEAIYLRLLDAAYSGSVQQWSEGGGGFEGYAYNQCMSGDLER